MRPLGPFGEAPRLAAGVSGGPHSLALALLAHDFARARGGDLLALVADHGLRPESAAEAEWTRETLRRRGIAAEILALNLPPGAAVQERARTARLHALLAACGARGRPWLLLGQHRLDQAETVLFRALRGSGPLGLAGMAPLRAAAEAVILRPLLGVPPGRLEALLRAQGLAPLRDPSNDNPAFTRVRLRRSLDDAEGEGPRTAALAAAASAFRHRRVGAEAAMAERLAAAVTLHPEGWARLDASRLGQDKVAQSAMAALLRLLSGAEHAPSAEAVAGLLERGKGTLHGVAWTDGLLCREPAACAAPVPAVAGALWDGRWRLGLPPDQEGLLWGGLGKGVARLARGERRGLPARVLAGLGTLWRGEDLIAVPALGLGRGGAAFFAPAGGPLCAYK